MMHYGEDTRWDFKVIIAYKNAVKGLDHGLTEQYKKQLYTDLENLKKDEQHRFELLPTHWDIMTERVEVGR